MTEGIVVSTVTKTKTEQTSLTGADILVEALIHQGAKHVFAYPGGASMPLHQALRKCRDRTIQRNVQG